MSRVWRVAGSAPGSATSAARDSRSEPTVHARRPAAPASASAHGPATPSRRDAAGAIPSRRARRAIGGSSRRCSRISSTTSGSSPSTTPRRSGAASTPRSSRWSTRSRLRRDPREVHRRRRVRGLRLADRPTTTTPSGPTHCALAIRDGLTRLEDPAGRGAPGPDRAGDRRGRRRAARRARRARLVADRAGRHDRRPDPGARPAGRDPPRRGDGPGGPEGLAIEDLGEQLLRGQTRPVRIGAAARRGRVPAVAAAARPVRRPDERARPRSRSAGRSARRAAAAADPVEGEAGIGKSRLLADLEAEARAGRASPGPGSTTCRTAAASRTGSPGRSPRSSPTSTAPIQARSPAGCCSRDDVGPAEARRWAGADRGDRPRRRVLRLGGRGATSSRPTRPTSPATCASRGRPLHRAADRVSTGRASIVVDDLHWLDPSSAGIFEELVGLSSRLPLVVLVGSRPRLGAGRSRRLAGSERSSWPASTRPRPASWRGPSPARRRCRSTSPTCTSGRAATRCSSARRSGRSSTTARSRATAGSRSMAPAGVDRAGDAPGPARQPDRRAVDEARTSFASARSSG